MRSEVTDVGVAYLSRHIDVRLELNSSAAGTKHWRQNLFSKV